MADGWPTTARLGSPPCPACGGGRGAPRHKLATRARSLTLICKWGEGVLRRPAIEAIFRGKVSGHVSPPSLIRVKLTGARSVGPPQALVCHFFTLPSLSNCDT